ncbi:MAG: proline iminopeptidase [Gammaproteobacteria bacterium]|jgi:proline iminopeptidase
MRVLYPEIQPFRSQLLSVDDIQQVYFEESGNRKGTPVIFLHGGPGSGSNGNHRRYFDPGKYHIINFDQRGCNRSTPNGCVENNTTQILLQDIEAIREYLNIDRWLIFGGSWGATLGLLYAEAYPERVKGMVLRGTFLARKTDLDWFVKEGANRIFPDYWQDFIQLIPEDERNDMVSAYHVRLHGNDKQAQKVAAVAWSVWAGRIVTYMLSSVNPDTYQPGNIEQTINEVLIETHYARNAYFIKENQILTEINSVPEVPIIIIHGRKDLTCTLDASWELHRALPRSNLVIVRDGGHLAGETPMVDALITATDKMTELLA